MSQSSSGSREPREGHAPASESDDLIAGLTEGNTELEDLIVVRRTKPTEEEESTEDAQEDASVAAAEVAPAEEPPKPTEPVMRETIVEGAELPDDEFAALLASSMEGVEQEREVGEVVVGTLLRIQEDVSFVDIGAKAEGRIETSELRGPDAELRFAVGDQLEAFIVGRGPEGSLRLSHTVARGARTREELEDAFRTSLPVTGKIVGVNKGGFDVRIGGVRAFLPAGQAGLRGAPSDHEALLGETISVRVTELGKQGRNVVVSRRSILAEQAKEFMKTLESGSVHEGRVTSIREFGLFVEIGAGVEGMVHISEISHVRVGNISEVLKVGDGVRVQVLKVDKSKKKISLSMKACTADPWDQVGSVFVQDGIYEGPITRMTDFGAFVELAPGLEGLLHVSQMTWDRRVRDPSSLVSAGDHVRVVVLEVDRKRRRLSLGMKQVDGDPWADVRSRFPRNSVVSGTVERVESFGVLLKLAEGVVGLIPNNELGTPRGSDHARMFPVGMELEVLVKDIDLGSRRIRLSKKSAKIAQERAEYRQLSAKVRATEDKPLGSLADLFGGLKIER